MKKIKFAEKFGPGLSSSYLGNVHEKFGRIVPDQILKLLRQANGGYPKSTVFPIEGMKNNETGEIEFFYGIDEVPDRDLAFCLETYFDRMPVELFPFGCDGSGDQICLITDGPRAGQVVFWDCYDERSKPSWKNVYKIADTFDEFIESLTEYIE